MFVIEIHGFYNRTQIKLSTRYLIPGIAQQHHQLIKGDFSSQIKKLKCNWPHLDICMELDVLLKLTDLTGATKVF